ncbi:hypothetical protein CNY67_11680 [Desulfovibrio sp. G11]|nr:hypothetical protein CNY67_11680 [Desulfovibrio sp. G11]
MLANTVLLMARFFYKKLRKAGNGFCCRPASGMLRSDRSAQLLQRCALLRSTDFRRNLQPCCRHTETRQTATTGKIDFLPCIFAIVLIFSRMPAWRPRGKVALFRCRDLKLCARLHIVMKE